MKVWNMNVKMRWEKYEESELLIQTLSFGNRGYYMEKNDLKY